MTVQDLGSLGEFVAALATVLTLIYLATQIRQNTKQLHGESIIAINNAEEVLTKGLREDQELVVLFVRALNDWDSVSTSEQVKVHLYLHPYARWCESCWLLWNRGALDDTTYSSRERMTMLMLSPSGARTWWESAKGVFDPRFCERIEAELAALGEDAPSVLDVPFYQRHLWQDRSS